MVVIFTKSLIDIIATIGFILLFITPKTIWHVLMSDQKVGFMLLMIAGIIIICLTVFSGITDFGQGYQDSPFH